MSTNYLKKAKLLFNTFKNRNITNEEISLAQQKAANLGEKSSDFNLMISMIRDSLSGKYKMNPWSMSIIIGTIIYVISPLDAVPDIIPVLGWLDDASIVGFAISKLFEEIDRYNKFKKSNINDLEF